MQRINGANALANANGPGKTGWQDYNAATGAAGTIPNAQTLNSWQEEIAGFIEAMGLTLNGADDTQLQQAVAVAIATLMRGMFAPEPTVPASMVVNLTAGYVPGAGTVTQVAPQATPAFVAPVGNPRIDRIVISRTTGALAVVAGTPAVTPVAPSVPAADLPIAQVALSPTTTAITAAMITDERDLPPLGLGALAYLGVGAGLALDGSGNLTLATTSVTGSGTAGHIVKWTGSATLGDGGALGTAAAAAASSATGTVAAVSGAIVSGHLAVYADTAGTVRDGGTAGALANLGVGNGLASSSGNAVVQAPDNSIKVSSAGVQVNETASVYTVNTTLTAANHLANIVSAAAISLTLPQLTGSGLMMAFWVSATYGAVTLVPASTDYIQNGAEGADFVIPLGSCAWVVALLPNRWYVFGATAAWNPNVYTAAQTFTQIIETVGTTTFSGGTLTLNLASGTVFNPTLTANVTSLVFSGVPVAGLVAAITLQLTWGGSGGYSFTWPAAVNPGINGMPVLSGTAGLTDTLTLFTTNGGAKWTLLLAVKGG